MASTKPGSKLRIIPIPPTGNRLISQTKSHEKSVKTTTDASNCRQASSRALVQSARFMILWNILRPPVTIEKENSWDLSRESVRMSPTLTCLALALVGVDLGYQPASNGGTEFIIQISPATLQVLRPGDPIEVDVPREAQGLRPSLFRIATGNEQLPHVVSGALLNAPTAAPIVQASPVMPAMATAPTSSSAIPSPSSLVQAKPTVAHTRPLLDANPATTAGSKSWGLAPLNPNGGPSQLDRPWLGMWLFVIALVASNVYVAWLFWDARQRYRGLLTQTFSLGQQPAEA